MIWAVVLLSAGVGLLWKGADLLVNGAVGLAQRAGISHLVVGLTVVAMGTSAPEVAASIAAAVTGKGDIAIGNVYGSNIANLALVGGTISLIRPLRVQARTLRREIPAMLAVAVLLWPLLRDLTLSRTDSVILAGTFAILVVYTIRTARVTGVAEPVEPLHVTVAAGRAASRDLLFVVVGLAALAVGARMSIQGAVVVGTAIGLSEAVIGSTIVAVGTSLPELVTCVVAAIKGHHDISVGNLVGSNIFNTLLVTGAASLIRPFSVSARFAGGWDYWIMIAVSSIFAVAIVIGRRTIGRIGALVLLSTYGAYIAFLLSFTPPA